MALERNLALPPPESALRCRRHGRSAAPCKPCSAAPGAQARSVLPAWLGIGKALTAAAEKGMLSDLQEMYAEWPFFRSTIDLVEMVRAISVLFFGDLLPVRSFMYSYSGRFIPAHPVRPCPSCSGAFLPVEFLSGPLQRVLALPPMPSAL